MTPGVPTLQRADRRRVRHLTRQPGDRGEAFRQPTLIIRWGTTAFGFALAAPRILDGDREIAAWLLIVVGYTIYRTVRPIDARLSTTPNLVALILESALMVVGVVATGHWDSPFVFSVLVAVAVAGFAAGFGLAVRLAFACALAIGIPSLLLTGSSGNEIRLLGQWSVELLLVALVAGYARRASGDVAARHSAALDRVGRLADANALLFSLHQVAQDLPSSLDLEEVLDSTIERLRDLIGFEHGAILLRDDSDGSWQVARHYGGRLAGGFARDDLPAPVAQATDVLSVVSMPSLLRNGGPGIFPHSGSGLYAVLSTRSFVVGVLALEHSDDAHFTERDTELLAGFAEPAALAIDNARWFSRLRTVGADEERTRIARDLHDRIGQSLAYLAFELDRIVRKDGEGQPPSATTWSGLRNDVRGVVREVRDTLYDLRTDVTDQRSLSAVLDEFL